MGSRRLIVPVESLLTDLIDHRGRTPKKLGTDFSESGVPVVSAKNIKNSRIDMEHNIRFVTESTFKKWMPRRLRAGDVLVTSEAPLGEVAYLDDDRDLVLGQRLFALRADERKVHGRYLFYLLRSAESQAAIHARATGTTAQGIRQSELLKVKLEIPEDVVEQRTIASILGALDDKIEVNRKIVRTLKLVARTLYLSACTSGSPGGLIPVREACQLLYGKTLRAQERHGGAIPVFGSNGIIGWHDHAIVSGPGVIVGRKGTAGAVTWSQGDFYPIDTTFYVQPKNGIPIAFLFYALRELGLETHGSDSAVPGLNRDAAYMMKLFVPSASALSGFARTVEPLHERIAQADIEISTLAELRDALLPGLVSGERSILDSEAIVSEAV